MTLIPPAHISGPFLNTTPMSLRHERFEWIEKARKAGHSNERIARALGVTGAAVRKVLDKGRQGEPLPAVTAAIPRHNIRMPADIVSLPPNPWDEGERMAHDPRHETYPRFSLVKRPSPTLTKAEATIAAIRAMRDEMRERA